MAKKDLPGNDRDTKEKFLANTPENGKQQPRHLLKITRILNAPPSTVFKAWTDPMQLAKWWGPTGYTNPVCKLDLKPGGGIYIDMKSSDGTVFPMKGIIHEIANPSKLVFSSFAFEDEAGHAHLEILNTVTFEEYQGKTMLTLNAEIQKVTAEVGEAMKGVTNMDDGWNQSLDRLEELVEDELS